MGARYVLTPTQVEILLENKFAFRNGDTNYDIEGWDFAIAPNGNAVGPYTGKKELDEVFSDYSIEPSYS